MATKAATKKAAAKAAAGPAKLTAMVNGQMAGSIDAKATIIETANRLAADHGLKAFSLKINGSKVTAESANKAVPASAKSIEVYAKDTRGQS